MDRNDDTVFTINSNGHKLQQGVQKVWSCTIGKYGWYDYSDDLYECIGDSQVSVMTSQGDNHLCDKINSVKKIKTSLDAEFDSLLSDVF